MNFFLCNTYKLAGAMVLKNAHTSIICVLDKYSTKKPWYKNISKDVVPDDYRVFAFVRNPFSRIFSGYKCFYRIRYERAARRYSSSISPGASFSTFMTRAFPYLSIYNPHFRSFEKVLPFLPDRTELYRWEDFEKNFKYILKSSGINETDIKHAHPANSLVSHLSYQEHYNRLTKAIIEQLYKWDLENLNYSFDSYGELPTIGELKKR